MYGFAAYCTHDAFFGGTIRSHVNLWNKIGVNNLIKSFFINSYDEVSTLMGIL